jgi:hypothetical protein
MITLAFFAITQFVIAHMPSITIQKVKPAVLHLKLNKNCMHKNIYCIYILKVDKMAYGSTCSIDWECNDNIRLFCNNTICNCTYAQYYNQNQCG